MSPIAISAAAGKRPGRFWRFRAPLAWSTFPAVLAVMLLSVVRGTRVRGVHVGVVRARHRVHRREGDIDHRVDVQAGAGGRPASRLVCPVRRDRQRTGVRQCLRRLDPAPSSEQFSNGQGDIALYYLARFEGRRRRDQNHRVGGYGGVPAGHGRGVLRHRGYRPASWHSGGPGIELRGEQRGHQLGPDRTARLRGPGDRRLARRGADPGQQRRDRLHREGRARPADRRSRRTSPAARPAPRPASPPWPRDPPVRGSRRLHPRLDYPQPHTHHHQP